MDIRIKKKPWYRRYLYHIAGGTALAALVIYATIISLEPHKVKLSDTKEVLASAEMRDFTEYLDVEGIVQPIMTIQVNTMESGFVERIVAEDGAMLNEGDTILILSNPELLHSIEDENNAWEDSQRRYREQEIEMQQKSIVARRLVTGVDIWMNTPTRPLEASGTSGEKALMNGLINFSVLDGWWLEGYREGAGWALTEKRTYQNQEYQDQLDAATIYSIFENTIIPLYFDKKGKDYSDDWVNTIKNSIAQVAPHYTMKRQLDDYYSKFYNKESMRFRYLVKDNFAKAKEIAAWKEEVADKWDSIEVVSKEVNEELLLGNVETGKEYTVTLVVDEKGLDNAIGIEIVTTAVTTDGKEHVYSVEPLEMIKREGNLFTFQVKYSISNSGSFKTAFRMYPKNKELPHRQDYSYVRWF